MFHGDFLWAAFTEWKTDAFTNQATTSGQIYYLFSMKKFSPLLGFELGTSGTKPICYQLSYTGSDSLVFTFLMKL